LTDADRAADRRERDTPAPTLAGDFMPATEDPPLRLKEFGLEDGVAFVTFWALAVVVFLQFFTRYVLNDSLGWTEEGARYLLIAVTFLGGGMAVRRNANIRVEALHAFLPQRLSLLLLVIVDIAVVLFFGYGTIICFKLVRLMHVQSMAVIDLPMSVLYAVVFIGFLVMTLRSAWSAWQRLRGVQ
jgi:TRAP-type transport system small permease protein